MSTAISAVATAVPYRFNYRKLFPAAAGAPCVGFPRRCFLKQSTRILNMSVKKKKKKKNRDENGFGEVEIEIEIENGEDLKRMNLEEKMARKKGERDAYLAAAIVSSFGITSMAAIAVYYRFSWLTGGGEFPILEMLATFALSVGSAVGMEYWARWAHKQLWHASLWDMHESHHRARDGLFEMNDVFAIMNAVPAIVLLSFGFFNEGFFPGLCFGAGLGITVFGMAYMFVHDGLVHRRFPVGPIATVPYLRRVAAAHHLHHTDKFDGVPYGLFLGPKELEGVNGEEELEKEIMKRNKVYRS